MAENVSKVHGPQTTDPLLVALTEGCKCSHSGKQLLRDALAKVVTRLATSGRALFNKLKSIVGCRILGVNSRMLRRIFMDHGHRAVLA